MTRAHDAGVETDGQHVPVLLSVIQELYAAALDGTSEIWQTIYRQSSLLLESQAGGFVSADKANQSADVASLIGFDKQRAVQAYETHGIGADLIYTSTLAMASGSSFIGSRLIGTRALQGSPFYEILSAPERLNFVLGGILENDERHHSILCFWRHGDQRDFDEGSQATLATVLPHIRQALEVQRRVRGPQLDAIPARNLSIGNFQASRHGVLVLDGKGRVLFVNREGERIARAGDGIAIHNGFLRLADAGLANEIELMMSRGIGVARRKTIAPMRPVRIPQRSGRAAYELLMIPITDGVQRAILPPTAAFLVTITDPANFASLSQQRLRSYGLTSAEARLCQALISTGSLPDAADELHISWSTARSHLKRIFAKLGVSSQVQLIMRLVAVGQGAAG
ncbi:MAG: LuxR C-terminal-related transcriptional regulator [Gammaproteobacteria bacterium]